MRLVVANGSDLGPVHKQLARPRRDLNCIEINTEKACLHVWNGLARLTDISSKTAEISVIQEVDFPCETRQVS